MTDLYSEPRAAAPGNAAGDPALIAPAPDGELSPLDLYEAGLSGAPIYLRHANGSRELLPTRRWTAGLQPGDESLLSRCIGSTLDVGCGPGRLVAALHRRGQIALGVDVSSAAVALARAAGAPARLADVFDAVPGEGSWARLLLADGNVGIGGDLARLLTRCRDLLAAGGQVLVELGGPVDRQDAAPTRRIRLENEAGQVSSWFSWSEPGLSDLRRAADAAGMRIVSRWDAAGRGFVGLSPIRPPAAALRP
jgi:SAM-dependent methyltransferase